MNRLHCGFSDTETTANATQNTSKGVYKAVLLHKLVGLHKKHHSPCRVKRCQNRTPETFNFQAPRQGDCKTWFALINDNSVVRWEGLSYLTWVTSWLSLGSCIMLRIVGLPGWLGSEASSPPISSSAYESVAANHEGGVGEKGGGETGKEERRGRRVPL